jgi:GH24 family phage-related lysozyme (muramidase)
MRAHFRPSFAAAGRRGTVAAEARSNPFVGPVPFEQDDSDLFFGRAGEVRELVSRIVAHRVVIFYAPSGAGKTSLLNAGVLPALESEKGFEMLPAVRFSRVAADDTGNVYASITLACWSEGAHLPATTSDVTLAMFLAGREPAHDARGRRLPRAVVFDQFEEIFTAYPERWEDREGFFEQLGEALESDRYLRVVLSLREDYVAQLEPLLPLLPSFVRFRLERLERDGAVEAVTGPVAHEGRNFAPGVAEALVEDLQTLRVDVGGDEPVETPGEFVEPVQLQVVCRSIWSELPEDVEQITAEHVHTSGDVDEVLQRFYDDAVRSAAEAARVREGRLRKWIQEAFITSVGTRSTVYQGQAVTAGLPNAAVEVLEDRHVVRAERRAGARWYELTHDRFIGPIQEANAHYRERRARKLRRGALITVAAAAIAVGAAAAVHFKSSSGSAAAAAPAAHVSVVSVSPGRSHNRPGYVLNVQVASNGFRRQTLLLRATTLQAASDFPARGGVVAELVSTVTPSLDQDNSARQLWLPTPSSRAFRFRIVVSHGNQRLGVSDSNVLNHNVTTVKILRRGPGNITDSTTGEVCDTATCPFPYSAGTHVTLNAIPNRGAQFQHWGAPCSGARPTCSFHVGVDPIQVVAVFGGSAAPAAALVSRFDRRSLTPYRQRDRTYIGYGHQLTDADVHSHTLTIGGRAVRWGPRRPLTEDQVEQLLAQDLDLKLAQVKGLVDRHLTDNQWQALADFVYNEGIDAFRDSTLLKVINAGELDKVPAQLRLWRRAHGKILGSLIRRREAEIALWKGK